MGSFIQTVADVAGEMGSTEIIRLVRAAMQLHPSKRSVEQLTEKVLLAATSGQSGLEVAEYPKYRLKRSLEDGLTLFQRQCRIEVGIIDLLFVDRKRNYVVVEIKRPSAGYREVVGQITTYMGWVRKNIARDGQTVRGIIVVGRKNQHLEYSLDLLPDISVKTFL